MLAPTVGNNWICLGFKVPENAAWLDAEAGRHVYLHSSGVRHVIQADNTVTVEHPSGAAVTIAPDGKVTVKAIGEGIFDMPQATFTGKIVAAGDIETAADVKAGNIRLKTHRHPNGNPQTGQPIP